MFRTAMTVGGFDPELDAAINGERQRQEDHIELIASENYASPRVLEAQGSALTNKYAEGYPGKRYYGGCEFVDIAEQLAIDRAKKLFGADYANVQPHSGSQANAAAYLALINPGDTILGMSLDHGGHLTHGAKVNFSGKLFRAVQYGIRPDNGEIDYDALAAQALGAKSRRWSSPASPPTRACSTSSASARSPTRSAPISWSTWRTSRAWWPRACIRTRCPTPTWSPRTTHKTLRGPRGGMILARANDAITKKLNSLVFPGTQGGPLMHVIAAKAVALLEALQPEFKDYQKQVVANARAMCARLQKRGYKIVCGGTDNHLFLLDLSDKAHHRQGCGCRARQGAHHRQQERGAERSAPAHGHQRHSHRHARRHHARLQGARVRADRRLDCRRARCQRQRRRHRQDARGGVRPVPAVSGLRSMMRAP